MKHKYSPDLVAKIRLKSDLAKIASECLELRKTSGWTGDYTGLCPFHKERTPSFRIIDRKQFFCCYGCGNSGDVFDFLMQFYGFNFIESVEYLGKRIALL